MQPQFGLGGSPGKLIAPTLAVLTPSVLDAVRVELSLHFGLYQHLEFSAHATVLVVLPGCVSVARAVRSCVVWTPLPGVLPV